MDLFFCGRQAELEAIRKRWLMASDITNPKPQFVLLKAERGLGKTRTAAEFYRWLSSGQNSGRGYWPESVGVSTGNLDVNPDPYECRYSTEIPFLWWGLRASDPGSQDSVAGDAIATYDRFLAPHLAALLARARTQGSTWDLTKAWASVGLDLAANSLDVDTILTIGKGFLETARVLTSRLAEDALTDAVARPMARSAAVLSDMTKVLNPASPSFGGIPAVVLIDDAQFAHADASLPAFLERLIHTAFHEKWPILVIATHWKAELHPSLVTSERSVAGILRHVRFGETVACGPAAGLPGGYLGSESYAEIELEPVPDLSPALRQKLPGIDSAQATAILEHMGGNPRYLEQVIAFLLENESAFVDLDATKALTAEGLTEALEATRSQEIFRIVLRRIRRAPLHVQEAVCVASLQGMRFAMSVIDGVAARVLGRSIHESLSVAEDPYAIVVREGKALARFPESLFYQAACHRRQSLQVSGGTSAMEACFREMVLTICDDEEALRGDTDESKALIYVTAADLFEKSADVSERVIARRALGELARLQMSQYSFEATAATYERLLAIVRPDSTVHEARLRIRTLEFLADLYLRIGWPAKAASAHRRIHAEVTGGMPALYKLFLHATDIAAARKRFASWRRRKNASAIDLYKWGVRTIASAVLNLSELAKLPVHLRAEGDAEFGKWSFIFHVVPFPGDKQTAALSTSELRAAQAGALLDRAYALEGVLGVNEVLRLHVHVLEQLAKLADSRNDQAAAEAHLTDALALSRTVGDVAYESSVLNNLGATSAARGLADQAQMYFESARALIEQALSGETFEVDLVLDNLGDDGKVVGSRSVGKATVPASLSKEFDRQPEMTVHKTRTLRINLAGACANLGLAAWRRGEMEASRSAFLRALSIREEVGDNEGMTKDLTHLGGISIQSGDVDSARKYWQRSLQICRDLQKKAAGTITSGYWAECVAVLEKKLTAIARID